MEDNVNVLHGSTVFLLVFLPVLAVFGVAFTYLRWKGRLAIFRARSVRIVQRGLLVSEVGPAVEDPAPIFNQNNDYLPPLPGYTETSTPLEPPPPYDGANEVNRSTAVASRESPPSYENAVTNNDSPSDERTVSSGEDIVQDLSTEPTGGSCQKCYHY